MPDMLYCHKTSLIYIVNSFYTILSIPHSLKLAQHMQRVKPSCYPDIYRIGYTWGEQNEGLYDDQTRNSGIPEQTGR